MVDPVFVPPDPPVPPPFDDDKPWWRSRTIWGALIAGASGIVSMATGHVLTPSDQSMLTGDVLNLINAVSSIVTILASIWAWYGRTKANKSISMKKL